MRQAPTSVPIYQTATFSSGDAEELAAVLSGEQPGYAYSRIDNPTVVALGDAVAELHGAEAGIALATGMAAIHASFLSLLRAGDRLVIGQVGYGTTRTQAAAAFGRLGVDVAYVDTTDVHAVEAALAAARDADPPRRDHRQPDLRPRRPAGARRGRAPARGAADRRQHVRVAGGLPAARARRRPRDGVGDEVPVGPLAT